MPPTKRRILCVDDDDSICDLLETIFTHTGQEATAVTSPRQALALAERETFDLYILDTRFPRESGVELCRALRARAPAVPVVFYSGAVGDAEQEAGIAAGAAAYVPKPYIEELLQAVRRLLPPTAGDLS